MIEKVGQMAEDVAHRFSRRGFLHRWGRYAAGAALALAAGLAPKSADAAGGKKCCVYYGDYPWGVDICALSCISVNKACPPIMPRHRKGPAGKGCWFGGEYAGCEGCHF